MASNDLRGVVDYLKRIALKKESAKLSDGRLLEAFIRGREEPAFATIVRRHGAMVMGVCRRVLRDQHDAEDAFQATFLVLARKAASITSPKLLANWLYSVAFKTALKSHNANSKRRAKEKQVIPMPDAEAIDYERWSDLLPLLDMELSRLPEKYRVPIILCDLEGKTGKEAARQLGWPEGTVSGRLSRGRAMLAKRLKNRGIEMSCATILAQQTTSAVVPASLVISTAKAAAIVAAGTAAAGVVSVKVVSLMEGVLKTMLIAKLKTGGAALFVLAAIGVAGSQAFHAASSPGQEPPKQAQSANEQKSSDKSQAAAVAPIAPKATSPTQALDTVPGIRITTIVMSIQNSKEEFLMAPQITAADGQVASVMFADKISAIPPPNGNIGVAWRSPIPGLISHMTVSPKKEKDGRWRIESKLQADRIAGGISTVRRVSRFESVVQIGDSIVVDVSIDDKGTDLLRVELTVAEELAALEPPLVVRAYALKNQPAVQVAQTIQDIWARHMQGREALRVVSYDDQTNSVIVQARTTDLVEIERLIKLLDDGITDAGK